ncbi:MAG: hypothetical protein HXY50_13040 [Ignavibacteriaceae bacterium]|nr:hypothetical protein [Ignavibacteriaceae bacterium]
MIKQYIVQTISTAASNLRLNNQRIEVLAMLKEVFLKSKDIQHDLNKMKKITELSKFAIKLNEIYYYLLEGQIDFLKVSEKFKEHSFSLIKELNVVLDLVNPYTFRETIDHIIESEKKVVELIIEDEKDSNHDIDNSLKIRNTDEINESLSQFSEGPITLLTDQENIEIEDKSDKGFENIILNPIKAVDEILNKLNFGSEIPQETSDIIKIMQSNAEFASENGFEILTQMHETVAQGLALIQSKALNPSKEVIESLRSCLIVIVAVVKSKEVDIKNYLNRAEVFSKFLQKKSEANK